MDTGIYVATIPDKRSAEGNRRETAGPLGAQLKPFTSVVATTEIAQCDMLTTRIREPREAPEIRTGR